MPWYAYVSRFTTPGSLLVNTSKYWFHWTPKPLMLLSAQVLFSQQSSLVVCHSKSPTLQKISCQIAMNEQGSVLSSKPIKMVDSIFCQDNSCTVASGMFQKDWRLISIRLEWAVNFPLLRDITFCCFSEMFLDKLKVDTI